MASRTRRRSSRPRSALRSRKASSKIFAKAKTKDHLHAFSKLTETVDGEPRFLSDPPLLVPLRELAKS